MVDGIKAITHSVINDYIKEGINPNESIKNFVDSNEIKNKEILARVCEGTNKGIYLSIFKGSSKDNKKNIQFPTANKEDFDYFFNLKKEGENMYNKSPEHYKKEMFSNKIAKHNPMTDLQRLENIESIIKMRDKIAHVINSIEGMISSEKTAQFKYDKDFQKIANDIVVSNQSIVDYGSLCGNAVKHVIGVEPIHINEKIASIAADFENRNIKVNTDITKVASMVPDINSNNFKPAINYVSSIYKEAALCSIGLGLLDRMDSLDKIIEEEKF